MAESHGTPGTSDHGHHVAPISLYIVIFLALMIGTFLTVFVAKFDLGPMNNIVMLTVACAKALLVILYFMHVRWSSRLTWVVAASGFFWLLILFTLTMADYLTRGMVTGTLR
jgi:cytochrome c oxidase subunit 4